MNTTSHPTATATTATEMAKFVAWAEAQDQEEEVLAEESDPESDRYYANAEECPDCHGTGVYRPVDGPPETCDHARATGNESADGRCPEQFFLEATWGELRACQNPTLQWAVLKYLNRHIPFCAIASPERIIWDDGSVFVPSDAKPLRETGGTL